MSDIVEILMATYNGEKYIREQIDSILNQSDSHWHLTISDDSSTDGTPEIVDEYVRNYPDKIHRHFSGQRFGNARDHFFHLMKQCQADYMLFCDQDDVWFPEKVGTLRQALLDAEKAYGRETPILVFSDQIVVDEELNVIAESLMEYEGRYTSGFDYRAILFQNVITGCTMGINQSLASLAGKCLDSTQLIMHDWWVGVVAARFGKIIYIDRPLGCYRQHGNNSVGAKNINSWKYKLNRLMDSEGIKDTISKKKAQAGQFGLTYSESLSEDDTNFIRRFEKHHSGLSFYMRYAQYIYGLHRGFGMMLWG